MSKKMSWIKGRPIGLYLIIAFAMVAGGLLWRYHADFEIDITIELLGAFLTIVIIDQLLLKSKRKRWNLVRDEIEYTLGRTINNLREDVLIRMFDFEPEINSSDKTPEEIDSSIREQKDLYFQTLQDMSDEEILDMMKDEFLEKGYEDHFYEKAEDIWRLLNTRYSEHFEPELVEELLALNMYLRDTHNNIRFYKRSEDIEEDETDRMDYYERRGGRRIVNSTRKLIESLVKLKKMGYSRPPDKR